MSVSEKTTPRWKQLDRKHFHLVGIGVTHSIAPAVHNFVAQSLHKPWTFYATECPSVRHAADIFHDPDFVGGVVTMPYKQAIMPTLDGIDDIALRLGACNNVYLTQDGKLRGTNTDWRGIKGSLLDATRGGIGKAALIIGAGGASRAAVYALNVELECETIYVINRDQKEFDDLQHDTAAIAGLGSKLNLIFVRDVAQAQELPAPFYVVGTIPDFEPKSPEELQGRAILENFFSRPEKGVFLDMCFKPRVTRNIKLARRYGWETVEGICIIGHQIEEQYRLWLGEDVVGKIPIDEAWGVLRKAADESQAINF